MLPCGDGDDVRSDLQNYLGSSMPPPGSDSPERHRTPRGRGTAPRPPHMAAQGLIGKRTGTNAKTRRAGGVERSPLGDGLLGPRERSGSPGREGFPTFSGAFSFFLSPCLGFQLYGRRFFWGYYIIPPGIFFRVPRYFRSVVERPNLCPQVRGSSLAYFRFFF